MKRRKKSSAGLGSWSKPPGRSERFHQDDGWTDQPRSFLPFPRATPLVSPPFLKPRSYPLSRQAPSLARPQNSGATSPFGGESPVVRSWLWNNVIPIPGVAVVTGDVVWLSSERAVMARLEPELAAAGAYRHRVRILEAGADAFGLAVRNFESGVQRLREFLQGTSRVKVVIVDHFVVGSEPGRPEADVQRLSAALSSLHQDAAQFGTAVVLLYRLADRDIITTMKAITAFKSSSEVQAVFVVGLRGSRGVLLIEKSAAKIVPNEFPFRETTKNSIKTLMWDSRSPKDL
jgi:hypothetical protein